MENDKKITGIEDPRPKQDGHPDLLRGGVGRPKGIPNRVTTKAREAVAAFVDQNAHRMQEWLDEIAKDSPEKAFTLLKDILEYHVPKLARVEQQTLDASGMPTDPPKVVVEIVRKTITDT